MLEDSFSRLPARVRGDTPVSDVQAGDEVYESGQWRTVLETSRYEDRKGYGQVRFAFRNVHGDIWYATYSEAHDTISVRNSDDNV